MKQEELTYLTQSCLDVCQLQLDDDLGDKPYHDDGDLATLEKALGWDIFKKKFAVEIVKFKDVGADVREENGLLKQFSPYVKMLDNGPAYLTYQDVYHALK